MSAVVRATCPPTLREVRYICRSCDGIQGMRFALDYRPYRVWLMTCRRCGRYALLEALGRPVTGGFR